MFLSETNSRRKTFARLHEKKNPRQPSLPRTREKFASAKCRRYDAGFENRGRPSRGSGRPGSGGFEAPESSERRPIHTNRLQGLFRVGTAQATGGEVATEQRNRENVARPRLCVPEFRAVRPSCGRDFGASDRKAKKRTTGEPRTVVRISIQGCIEGPIPGWPLTVEKPNP